MTLDEMKARKKELGLSNETLAQLSGVPFSTVQKIFSGTTGAPRQTPYRLWSGACTRPRRPEAMLPAEEMSLLLMHARQLCRIMSNGRGTIS